MHHNEPRGGAMTMNMKDFLSRYFRQLHFDTMPEPVRRRFDSYVDKDDYIGDMKSWADDLLKKDANGKPFKDPKIQPDGHYVHNDLPNDKDMDMDNWKKLYELLQQIFTKMADDRDSLDKATVKFLDKYFGNQRGNIFVPTPLEQDTKDAVKALFNAVKSLDEKSAYTLFARCLHNEEAPTLLEFRDFKNAIENGSYEKNPAVRKTLRKFIVGLSNAINNGENIGLKINPMILEAIFYGLNPAKLATDEDVKKLQPNIKDILSAIHDNEKIAADVKRFDNGKISEPLEKAISKTDYTGKITEKNRVPEKYDDHLNFFERADKEVKDWVDDKIGVFKDFHREHIYHNEEAQTIMGVMLDLGISPTSGLKAIVDKEQDILGKLQGKQPLHSAEYFKWMVDELKRLRDGGMKKAFENATKEPGKMRSLAENIGRNSADAMKGLDNSKRKELKKQTTVAMEIMEVMEYGTFNSKTMEAVNKAEFKVFSDKDLSFNKGVMGNITSAIDKTLHKTIQLGGYAVTGAVNQIRKTQSQFNHTGALEAGHQRWQAENKKEKADFETTKDEQDIADDAEISKYKQIQNNTGIKNIDAAKSTLEVLRDDESMANDDLGKAKDKLKQLEQQAQTNTGFANPADYYALLSKKQKQQDARQDALKKAQDKLADLQQKEADYQEYNKLTTQFAKKGKELYNLQMKMNNANDADLEKLNQEFKNKTAEREQIQKQMKDLLSKYCGKGKPVTDEPLTKLHQNLVAPNGLLAGAKRGIKAAQKNLQDGEQDLQAFRSKEAAIQGYEKMMQTANQQIDAAQKKYDDAHDSAEDLAQKINDYSNAQSEIESLEQNKADRAETLANWDQDNIDYYDFFMGYWDFLHTGNTKRIFQFSRKAVQKKAFAGQMEKNLIDYMNNNNYSYAA